MGFRVQGLGFRVLGPRLWSDLWSERKRQDAAVPCSSQTFTRTVAVKSISRIDLENPKPETLNPKP